MEKYFLELANLPLFSGIAPENIPGLLTCFGARCVRYQRGEIIVSQGSVVGEFGILLSGKGRAIKTDESGRTVTITLLGKGNEIGAILASSKEHKSPVSVEVLEDAEVLKIPFTHMLTRCQKACNAHMMWF